jgi:peptidoglycan DL-endopeptidase CwlO
LLRRTSPRRWGLVAVAVCSACALIMFASSVVAAPSDIEAKRAEAQQVLAQLQEMDDALERAVEAYNGATYELGQIEAAIATNQRHLTIARRSYQVAQKNLQQRLVALYQDGEEDVIEVILGASNLDDLLDRFDSAQRISTQDVQIIESVTRTRGEIRRRERELERSRVQQRAVVDQRAAARADIERQIGERQAYYESVKGQIAELIAQEKERQQRLAEEQRRQQEEQRRLEEAAAAVGVDTSAVQVVAVPQGIGNLPAASGIGAQAATIALRYLGVPYVWGGMSPSGFDCSGLVAYAYAQLGVSLPHHAATMFGYGVAVSYDQLAPGDLVFANGLGHMGMYIGAGNYVHAPQTGDVVKIASMSSRSDWVGFRRVA